MTRWLVLAGHLSPYMAALWNGVASCEGNVVTVLHTRPHGGVAYSHERVAVSGASGFVETTRWDPGRGLESLRQEAPDILVSLGHSNPYALVVATLHAIRHPDRVRAYCGDTNGIEVLRRLSTGLRHGAIHWAKRAVISRVFTHALSLGWTNALALEGLGLRRVSFVPFYCVDFSHHSRGLLAPTDEARWIEMAAPKYLVVARCVPAKNLPALLEAWLKRQDEGAKGSLTVVGDGPELPGLRRRGAGVLRHRLWLVGAREPPATRTLIETADCLVLPSVHEPWGIVVVEALGAGVPCICSDRVGSAVSLGPIAGNALLFTVPNERALRRALQEAEESLVERRKAAARVAATIRGLYGIEAGVDRLVAWGSSRLAESDRGE